MFRHSWIFHGTCLVTVLKRDASCTCCTFPAGLNSKYFLARAAQPRTLPDAISGLLPLCDKTNKSPNLIVLLSHFHETWKEDTSDFICREGQLNEKKMETSTLLGFIVACKEYGKLGDSLLLSGVSRELINAACIDDRLAMWWQ